MKSYIVTIMALLSLTTAIMANNTATIKLRLIETSDVHGAFFPYNFIERRPMQGSMARISTYIKQQREQYGQDHVVLLDCGDILQGQPTCYYCNYVNTRQPNVAAEVINYLHYDAQTVGNHDIETGHPVYDKWIGEVECPMLGANIIDTSTEQPYVKPYTIVQRQGVRIGIVGLLTPAIPNWLHQSLWQGLRFDELTATAHRWARHLRDTEKVDIVVGLFHSGWDGGIATMHYDEDATRKISEANADFDIIFFGHDHTEHLSTSSQGTLCLNPSCNAQKVAAATVVCERTAEGVVRIVEKQGEIVDIRGYDIDTAFTDHFKAQADSVSQFVDRQIGTFELPIRSRDSFFGSAPFTDYIHELQLELTGADVSFNAPLTFDSEIKAGPVYVSDMFKLYRYENQIYVLRMTGDEIRRHLELSYDQWVNTMTEPTDHIMLLTDHAWNDQQRMGFKNLTFNFDSAAGIDYEVDVTKPDGEKVRILRFSDGRDFDSNAWYRVAMNSYRGNGGGELLVRGAGIPFSEIPKRIEYMSERDQRHYLTAKIEREGVVKPRALNNWRFVPEEWTAPAIARDRQILFP